MEATVATLQVLSCGGSTSTDMLFVCSDTTCTACNTTAATIAVHVCPALMSTHAAGRPYSQLIDEPIHQSNNKQSNHSIIQSLNASINHETTKRMTQPDESTKSMWTGSYAEFMAVPAENVAMMPPNLSFEEAAGVPLTALTAWQVNQR